MYWWPGPLYSCVINASKTKMAVRSVPRMPAKRAITGTLASVRRSRLSGRTAPSNCARWRSTRNDPRVRQRTESTRSRIRHHSTNVIAQRTSAVEYMVEYGVPSQNVATPSTAGKTRKRLYPERNEK
jgi:hypothetical protein